jgi:eukaryotic-like serine/threonine-protein kinase
MAAHVPSTPDSGKARTSPEGDGLRELCFSDAVFRERYEGWRLLGRGSWATVVRTRSRDAGRDVALKIFVNLDPELLRRLREEVRAAQALATPYLVQSYSLFDRGTIAWFEMEVVEGPTLQEELDRLASAGARLSLVRSCEIALAVSRCVWQAHRHGVLHRDIKPANVLLPASGRPAAKLGDFGVARLADASGATPPGTIVGTPRFASPESLSGQAVGTAHDVYGLAATLYAIFGGGRLPYSVPANASLARLRTAQRTERPAPLLGFAPEMDPRLERTILEALSPDPAERPSARKLVLALERAQVRALAAAAMGYQAAGLAAMASRLKITVLDLASRARRALRRLLKRQPGG